jgi:hypothetical protein
MTRNIFLTSVYHSVWLILVLFSYDFFSYIGIVLCVVSVKYKHMMCVCFCVYKDYVFIGNLVVDAQKLCFWGSSLKCNLTYIKHKWAIL